MKRPFIAFHFALVQDVAVLRPLAQLAGSLASADVHLLVSDTFAAKDDQGRWMAEIERLSAELGVTPFIYTSAFDCLRKLGSGHGMIIAGSESDAPAHHEAHELFRAVPGRFRTVTLQHGFECVGFLHNARHDATAGRSVRFAADIAVAWFERRTVASVTAAERSKLYVAGPQIMIDPPQRRAQRNTNDLPGLICENLHSVRFKDGHARHDFLTTFRSFASRVATIDQTVALRAHPGGRFTQRNDLALPPNVTLSRDPLYDLDLAAFAFAISAPSTILFDFALAGVPVATWVDIDGGIDASNFAGFAHVATVEDWWNFNFAARWKPELFIEQQDKFIAGLGIPSDVKGRYEQLLSIN
jgi:hypothetical protein